MEEPAISFGGGIDAVPPEVLAGEMSRYAEEMAFASGEFVHWTWPEVNRQLLEG